MDNLKITYGLPNKLRGKSFAEASKIIESMFKNRMSVPDIRTKKELMSRLKDVQELQKSQENIVNTNNQLGVGGFPVQFNDIITKASSIIEAKRDEFGNALHEEVMPSTYLNSIGNSNKLLSSSDNILGGIGLAASVLGPMISNRRAMKSLQKPEEIKPYLMNESQYKPELVNRQQLLRNADEQAATQRYLMDQMGGDMSQRSAMLANLNANRLYSTGNLMLQSNLADVQEKARIQQLRGNIQQFNIGQREKADELNAQNEANYYNTIAAYKQAQGANIGSIGQSLFNMIQAKKYGTAMGQAAAFSKI